MKHNFRGFGPEIVHKLNQMDIRQPSDRVDYSNRKRNRDIALRSVSGSETYKQIASDYNLNPSTIPVITHRTCKRAEKQFLISQNTSKIEELAWYDRYDISIRASNCLRKTGMTEEDFRALFVTYDGFTKIMMQTPNFGLKSAKEVYKALGLGIPSWLDKSRPTLKNTRFWVEKWRAGEASAHDAMTNISGLKDT
jgi:hypothetical protein